MATSPTILEEAQQLVYGDRQAAYGHPADDMGCTGAIWEALLNRMPGVTIPRGTITARVASVMMAAGVKATREVFQHQRDNLTDMAGWAGCAQLCAEREEG